MSVRTPDPNSGWLGDDELAAIDAARAGNTKEKQP
jgi:hypothetical protein